MGKNSRVIKIICNFIQRFKTKNKVCIHSDPGRSYFASNSETRLNKYDSVPEFSISEPGNAVSQRLHKL